MKSRGGFTAVDIPALSSASPKVFDCGWCYGFAAGGCIFMGAGGQNLAQTSAGLRLKPRMGQAMSKNTKAMAHKGNSKGCTAESRQSIDHCGEPSVRQIDETAIVLMKAHPDWNYARCQQRARVVVYTGAVN